VELKRDNQELSNDQKVEALDLDLVQGKFEVIFAYLLGDYCIIPFISDPEAAVQVDRAAEAKARVNPEVDQVKLMLEKLTIVFRKHLCSLKI
jgi:hypothetical protein